MVYIYIVILVVFLWAFACPVYRRYELAKLLVCSINSQWAEVTSLAGKQEAITQSHRLLPEIANLEIIGVAENTTAKQFNLHDYMVVNKYPDGFVICINVSRIPKYIPILNIYLPLSMFSGRNEISITAESYFHEQPPIITCLDESDGCNDFGYTHECGDRVQELVSLHKQNLKSVPDLKNSAVRGELQIESVVDYIEKKEVVLRTESKRLSEDMDSLDLFFFRCHQKGKRGHPLGQLATKK